MKKYFEKIHLSMDSLPTYLAQKKARGFQQSHPY